MLPYVLMLSATLTHYVECAMIKTYNKKYASGGFMFIAIVSFFSALFFLGKYLFFDGVNPNFNPEVILYGIIAGVMYAASSVLVFLAIKIGSLAVTNLILGYNTIVTSLYGIIFLGERAGLLTYVGIAVMIFALFLLKAPEESNKEDNKTSLLWFIFAILGMLTSAGYAIVTKTQQIHFDNVYNNEFIIIAVGFSAVATFIIGIVTEKREAFNVLKTCVPYAGLAGLSNGVTNLLSLVINTLIAISISSPTRSLMTKILHFVLGYFVFKERYSVKQIIGLALVCVAVILINVA